MREPRFVDDRTGEEIVFSRAPTWMLQHIALIPMEPDANGKLGDDGFERRYAAIILAERA